MPNATCNACHREFIITSKRLRTHKKLRRKNLYCSRDCLHKWQSENFRKEREPFIRKMKEKLPDGMAKCAICGTKSIDEFGKKDGDRLQSYCKKCLYLHQMRRWNKRKIDAINYLGGKCSVCGFAGHPAAFDFHHREPEHKEFDWHKMRIKKWDGITKELDKCDLVCAICHRIKHLKDEMWTDLDKIERKERLQEVVCHMCGTKFKPNKKNRKFCSYKCSSINQEKIEWPGNLPELVANSSLTIVSKHLGVGVTAVASRLRNHHKSGVSSGI